MNEMKEGLKCCSNFNRIHIIDLIYFCLRSFWKHGRHPRMVFRLKQTINCSSKIISNKIAELWIFLLKSVNKLTFCWFSLKIGQKMAIWRRMALGLLSRLTFQFQSAIGLKSVSFVFWASFGFVQWTDNWLPASIFAQKNWKKRCIKRREERRRNK